MIELARFIKNSCIVLYQLPVITQHTKTRDIFLVCASGCRQIVTVGKYVTSNAITDNQSLDSAMIKTIYPVLFAIKFAHNQLPDSCIYQIAE